MSIKLTRVRAVIGVLALTTTLAGVSYAAVPDGDEMISACVDQKDRLIVIDAEAGETCGRGQETLSWNERGPVGPQGPAGPPGHSGAEITSLNVTSDGMLASTTYDGPVTIDHPSSIGDTPGRYKLTFTESVASCSHWLNFEAAPRIGTARVLPGDGKTLMVETYIPTGVPAHAWFTLHLAC